MKSQAFSLRSYAVVGILAGVFAAPAVSADELFRPYVGVGAQVLKLELDKAYGKPLFSKGVVPGAMAFAGVRFCDFFGAELGYNYFSRKRNSILGANDIFPGSGESLQNFLPGRQWLGYKTQTLIQDVNLGITGYLPLKDVACIFDKTEIFGTLGYSRTSVRMRLQVVTSSNPADVATPNPTHTFKQHKNVPIVRVGLQQNICENINLSLFSEWKRLSSFKMTSPTNQLPPVFELRLKNSVSYGLRLGYIF